MLFSQLIRLEKTNRLFFYQLLIDKKNEKYNILLPNKNNINKTTMEFIVIDKKSELKLVVHINEKDKIIKLENKVILKKYKLENADNIPIFINGLKKSEGLYCTFIDSKDNITIHINHTLFKLDYKIIVPLIVETELSAMDKLKNQIQILENKIEKLTTTKTGWLFLPTDLLLTEQSRHKQHASDDTFRIYDEIHIHLLKYDDNYSSMINELKQMPVKRAQSGQYNEIDNRDIYLNDTTWKLNSSISNILTYIYWKLIPKKNSCINFDIAISLTAHRCSHNVSGGVCATCITELKKKRVDDVERCSIPYRFQCYGVDGTNIPPYEHRIATLFFNIMLSSYYSHQGKHFENLSNGTYVEYIEDPSYHYDYQHSIYFLVNGKHYDIHTHKPVEQKMENLYKSFTYDAWCRHYFSNSHCDTCSYKPSIKIVQLIYRKKHDHNDKQVIYV